MKNLEAKSKSLRIKTLDMAIKHGGGHVGGSFSEIEILTALYEEILTKQDKFILSKGHACYPFYIILQEKGLNPKISGHPDIDEKNGINCTTGSLGHGLPIAVGMALAKKKLNKKGRIYVLIGDGEIQEGTTWESSLLAVHHKLDNLVVIIDYNKVQALEPLKNIVSLGNLSSKFREIGYKVIEINGHCISEIIRALRNKSKGKPLMIVAHTIKGKGAVQMENDPKWHAKNLQDLSLEELKKIYEELSPDNRFSPPRE
jgi:transketolase